MNNKTYWVVESINEINGNKQIVYWTGNIPHLSIQQSESGVDMWVTDIHKAQKFESPSQADYENEEFKIFGEVKEHMDVCHHPQWTILRTGWKKCQDCKEEFVDN